MWLPPLYAEIHYRGRFLPSRLFKPLPEIISDIPFRIEPGHQIPILILFKDADRFPVALLSVESEITGGAGSLLKETLYQGELPVTSHIWHKTFYSGYVPESGGILNIAVTITVKAKNKTFRFANHAYNGGGNGPHRVNYSKEAYPRYEGICYGDLHVHTSYTRDQVEFGAPLPAIQAAAHASGLDFACLTDHSYDMDDDETDPLMQDPSLQKWHAFLRETEELNGSQTVLIPGLEISCGNKQGRNVHLLRLNDPEFYHGSGDGAEKWLRTKPENSAETILAKKNGLSVSYAAHPQAPVSFLQQRLIRRGNWEETDLNNGSIDGMQILNGAFDTGFYKGRDLWIKLLLSGRKIAIGAGNDSHGNFNIFRQVKIPLLLLHEKESQILGKMRTGIYLFAPPTKESVLKALKAGCSFITCGPALNVYIQSDKLKTYPGGTVKGGTFTLHIGMKSSSEFGPVRSVTVFAGSTGAHQEMVLKEFRYSGKPFEVSDEYTFPPAGRPGYIRIEGTSGSPGNANYCLSNPIYIY